MSHATDDPSISDFERKVNAHTDRIARILVEKNKAYGNSALEPVRVFSKANTVEQLRVRIDDKLSRLSKGDPSVSNEDTIDDLIGYLILLKIASEKPKEKGGIISLPDSIRAASPTAQEVATAIKGAYLTNGA